MDKIFFVTSNKNHFQEEVDLTEVNNYLSKNKDYYVASVTPLYQSIAMTGGNSMASSEKSNYAALIVISQREYAVG